MAKKGILLKEEVGFNPNIQTSKVKVKDKSTKKIETKKK